MAFKIKEVPVRSVYLDNVNPRHDPIDNEPEIIELLLKKESVRPLAEDSSELEGAGGRTQCISVSPQA